MQHCVPKHSFVLKQIAYRNRWDVQIHTHLPTYTHTNTGMLHSWVGPCTVRDRSQCMKGETLSRRSIVCVCVCVCVWWSFSPAIPKDIWWNRFLQGRGVCMCVRPNTWRNGGPAVVDQYEGGLSTPLAQSKIQHTFHSIPSWPQPVLGDKHPCSALFLKENSPLRACNEWLSTPPRTWWSTWSTPVVMTSLRRLIPTPPWAVALIRIRLSREGRGQTHTTISAVHAMTEPFPWRNIPKFEPRSTIPRQLMGTSAIHILGIYSPLLFVSFWTDWLQCAA